MHYFNLVVIELKPVFPATLDCPQRAIVALRETTHALRPVASSSLARIRRADPYSPRSRSWISSLPKS